MATFQHKPIGGVVSARLYPTEAVESVIFSGGECRVELSGECVEVLLLDDASLYEEQLHNRRGAMLVEHRLTLVAERNQALEWLDGSWQERLSTEGVVAVVGLNDGRELLVGYSSYFGAEQPLHLDSLVSSSGRSVLDTPCLTLQLTSFDTRLSCEIK